MAAVAGSNPSDLKCFKCRNGLEVSTDDVVDQDSADQSLVVLREDKLPEWVQVKIEEVKPP